MNNDIRTEEQETVSGIVDSIIYQNEDNGYVVFEMEDTSGYPVTVTGIIPYLTDGDKLTVTGKWVNHKTYGKQFEAQTYEKTLPAEESDILRYLSSGAVKGIGPKTAQKIVEQFGTDAKTPEMTRVIPGVDLFGCFSRRFRTAPHGWRGRFPGPFWWAARSPA